MRVLTLRCDSCAAPLEVPSHAKRVTCTYCNADLVVQQGGGVAFTEAMRKVEAQIEELRQGQARLERQRELEALDQAWEEQREPFLIRSEDGRAQEPNRPGALIEMLFYCLIGLPLIATQAWPITAFLMLFGFVRGRLSLAQAEKYEGLRQEYRARRRQLLSVGARG